MQISLTITPTDKTISASHAENVCVASQTRLGAKFIHSKHDMEADDDALVWARFTVDFEPQMGGVVRSELQRLEESFEDCGGNVFWEQDVYHNAGDVA